MTNSTETVECPYCDAEKKPRGLKSHIRLSSGDGHGESGEMPDDADEKFADAKDSLRDDGEKPQEAAQTPEEVGVTEVSSEDFGGDSAESDAETDDSNGEDDYPFDPNDPGAIRLDGGETVDIRKDGEVYPGVEADEGDYLLSTDKGPVLYDADSGEAYEVLTL